MKSFFKKETDADRVRSEIEGMKFKKSSILAVLENERGELEKTKTRALYEVGLYVYENHEKGSEELEFTQFWGVIEEINGNIQLKNDKIKELDSRYDEDISLLQANLNMIEPPIAPVSATVAIEECGFCEQCGNKMKKGDMFCQSCGTKVAE